MESLEIEQILFSLLKNNENECVEYKEAKNNFDSIMGYIPRRLRGAS